MISRQRTSNEPTVTMAEKKYPCRVINRRQINERIKKPSSVMTELSRTFSEAPS